VVDFTVLGQGLDFVILKVLSNLNNFMYFPFICTACSLLYLDTIPS